MNYLLLTDFNFFFCCLLDFLSLINTLLFVTSRLFLICFFDFDSVLGFASEIKLDFELEQICLLLLFLLADISLDISISHGSIPSWVRTSSMQRDVEDLQISGTSKTFLLTFKFYQE